MTPRKTLQINNACSLIAAGENGENLFLSSQSKNQFFENRELPLSQIYFSHEKKNQPQLFAEPMKHVFLQLASYDIAQSRENNVYLKHIICQVLVYCMSPLTIIPGSRMAVANGAMGVSFGF